MRGVWGFTPREEPGGRRRIALGAIIYKEVIDMPCNKKKKAKGKLKAKAKAKKRKR